MRKSVFGRCFPAAAVESVFPCRARPRATVTLPLIRLRYGGSASIWRFGLYLAGSGTYENQILPTGMSAGTPQEALDCACDPYLSH
ncbi:hypothetical protein AB0392_49530 [Nonomuraea angiospora]|uniref:hypothetical protein n=1 Tax=Nonomuraea angiospora TaxID=46172 RepID=UPI00344E342E